MQKSNKLILAALSVPVVLGLGYFLFKKQKTTPQTPFEQLEEIALPQINQNKLQPIVRQIKRQLMDSPLSQQSQLIKKIYQRSIELIITQYVNLVLQQRIKRRKLIKNRQMYVQQIIKQEQQKKLLKEKALNTILAQINLSEDSWSQAIMVWSSQNPTNEQQWGDLIVEMQNMLLQQFQLKKQKLPAIQSILQSHIKFLQKIDKSKPELQNVKWQDLAIVINIMVDDELYSTYKIQNEDITAHIASLKEKQRKKLNKYFDTIQQLIQDLIVPDDEQNSQEGQQEQQTKS